jgi:hypothetical protein
MNDSRQNQTGSRGRLPTVVLVAAILAIGLGSVALVGGKSGASQKRDRRQLVAFENKLVPLVNEWGKIEVDGMRPAIADLSTGGGVVPPEGIAGEARAWQSGLVDLRAKIAALVPPPRLVPAKSLFDQAMVRYINAAKLFEQAADGPADQRKAGIQKGIDAATSGAQLYNEASLILQAERHRVGLPTTSDFPDHPAGDEKISG